MKRGRPVPKRKERYCPDCGGTMAKSGWGGARGGALRQQWICRACQARTIRPKMVPLVAQ